MQYLSWPTKVKLIILQIDSFVDERISVEAISAKSHEFLAYLYSKATPNFIIELPVHFRYNLPSKQRYSNYCNFLLIHMFVANIFTFACFLYSYSKIKIEYPKLFSCCPENNHLKGLNGQVQNKKCPKIPGHTDWSVVDYEVGMIIIF